METPGLCVVKILYYKKETPGCLIVKNTSGNQKRYSGN